MQRYSDTVGAATLAVLWSEVGDPVAYGSAGAYLKAFGLNLKERSSGKRLGQLAISKRGPAMSRRWLFFWALRAVQRDELKGWYEALIQVGNGSCSSEHRNMKGLIAMMRKLCKSLWHAQVHNKVFDYLLVINGKPPRRRRRRRKAAKRFIDRDIPCQVASPQSLTPFLAAPSVYQITKNFCPSGFWMS